MRAIPTSVGAGLGGMGATEINDIENLPDQDGEIFAFYSPVVKGYLDHLGSSSILPTREPCGIPQALD
jgi:hypothetical protein